MKLFELVLYQSCNYHCEDCPMERWLYEPDELFDGDRRRNALTNEALLAWLDAYLDPKEWFIEITGGEPSLYPQIHELIPALSERGYKGIIRTNGSNPLPYNDNFKRVVAWHKLTERLPETYDYILILENPNDDWQAKKAYCEESNIPHVVFPYKFYSKDCSQTTYYEPKINRIFKQVTTVFASGAIGGCQTSADTGISIFNMDEPTVANLCLVCGTVEALEYFIDNIPGFKETLDLSNVPVFTTRSSITYPLLTIDNKWVDKDGNVVGVLGDDISEIPLEVVYKD